MKICFSYLIPNLKIAGRELSPDILDLGGSACSLVFAPPRATCVECVWSQLSSASHRRAAWNQLAPGGLCHCGLVGEQAGHCHSSSSVFLAPRPWSTSLCLLLLHPGLLFTARLTYGPSLQRLCEGLHLPSAWLPSETKSSLLPRQPYSWFLTL